MEGTVHLRNGFFDGARVADGWFVRDRVLDLRKCLIQVLLRVIWILPHGPEAVGQGVPLLRVAAEVLLLFQVAGGVTASGSSFLLGRTEPDPLAGLWIRPRDDQASLRLEKRLRFGGTVLSFGVIPGGFPAGRGLRLLRRSLGLQGAVSVLPPRLRRVLAEPGRSGIVGV
ncbi:hypothetical protein ACFQ07_29315, partial [Actinomadura adrarensis]